MSIIFIPLWSFIYSQGAKERIQIRAFHQIHAWFRSLKFKFPGRSDISLWSKHGSPEEPWLNPIRPCTCMHFTNLYSHRIFRRCLQSSTQPLHNSIYLMCLGTTWYQRTKAHNEALRAQVDSIEGLQGLSSRKQAIYGWTATMILILTMILTRAILTA